MTAPSFPQGDIFAMAQCEFILPDGTRCREEELTEKERALVHNPGISGLSHHECKVGHAWHRNTGGPLLITPCDCTGHARHSIT
jgi:hypothetical protein